MTNQKKYLKKYYQDNKEKMKASAHKQYHDGPKDYYKKNKKKICKKQNKDYHKDIVANRKKQRDYYKKNKKHIQEKERRNK